MLTIFKNIYLFRELILNLVLREVQMRYRRTFFGFLWSFLNPLLLMMVYTLVFSLFVRIRMDNYSSFVFCGLLPWIWFTSSLNDGVNSLISNAQLVTKTYFPVEILPVVSVLTHLVNYLFSLPLLIMFLMFNKISLGLPLLICFIPLLLFQFLFTQGLVFITASLNVYFRDVQHILGNLLTLWFFLCPIIYPFTIIPEKYKFLIYLNPMALFSMAYQDVYFFNRYPELPSFITLLSVSSTIFFIGSALFSRLKPVFAEEL